MNQSRLLIVNSAVTYLRMFITVGMGLLATRWALQLLGDDQYGLYLALGGGAALLLLISDSLAMSLQRHIAHAIGRDDPEAVRGTMSTAVALFGGLAVLLCVVGFAVAGPLARVLTVPEGSEGVAATVFRLLALQYALLVVTTPARAHLSARQSILPLTISELVASVLRLGAVALLFVVDAAEPLLFFAVGVLLSSVPGALILVLGSLRLDPMARPSLGRVSLASAWQILAFASWANLGMLAWRLRLQGSQIVLNLAFGPTVNAALGVAVQASGYQKTLGEAIRRAALPAIITQHGKGNKTLTEGLVVASSKFQALAMALIAVPLLVDPDAALRVWLGTPPEGASIMLVLVVLATMLYVLSQGHTAAILAHGKLAKPTMWVSAVETTSLGVGALLVFAFGAPAWSVPGVAVVGTLVLIVGRVVMFEPMTGVGLRPWLAGVIRPVSLVCAIGVGAGLVPRLLLDAGLVRLVLVFGVSGLALAWSGWCLAMDPREKRHIVGLISSVVARLKGRRAGRGAAQAGVAEKEAEDG